MRKIILFGLALFITLSSYAQQKIKNIIVITTDGFRWQEVFNGMDSSIANNTRFNQGDSNYIYKKYWDPDAEVRRKKLLPFFWETIVNEGSIYGNRKYNNYVNVSNPYWFSYPGYSEIFCGFVDTAINSNGYKPNPNTNVLEFLNSQQAFRNKVSAFGAWNAFDRILNEQRAGFPVVSAFDSCGGDKPNSQERLINNMLRDSHKPWGLGECLDVFTHYEAMENLKKEKPSVLYIAYGETDEFAHSGQYKYYLDAAHQFDQWVKDLWNYVQSTSKYKDKTALFITTDHGRGDHARMSSWTSHGSDVTGADEIWFAVMAPGISPKGEIKEPMQLYQKQFAQTIAHLLGQEFKAEHPVAERIEVLKD